MYLWVQPKWKKSSRISIGLCYRFSVTLTRHLKCILLACVKNEMITEWVDLTYAMLIIFVFRCHLRRFFAHMRKKSILYITFRQGHTVILSTCYLSNMTRHRKLNFPKIVNSKHLIGRQFHTAIGCVEAALRLRWGHRGDAVDVNIPNKT